MLIESLVRKFNAMTSGGALPDPYLANGEVDFVIVLDRDGKVVGTESMFEELQQSLRGRKFRMPKAAKRSGTAAEANLLYDRADYVLGLPAGLKDTATNKEIAEAEKKAKAACSRFHAKIEALPEEIRADQGVDAVRRFLERPDLGEHASSDGLAVVLRKSGCISFRLDGDAHEDGHPRLVFERPAVLDFCRAQFDGVPVDALEPTLCPVTRQVEPIARLHSHIVGIVDAADKRGNATLVSYNENAFESYGLSGCANASISVRAERAYTTALNELISERGFHLNGVTYVGWSDAEGVTAIDTTSALLLGGYEEEAAQQTIDVETVKAILMAPVNGVRPVDDGTEYHIVGLTAAMARAVVRYHQVDTIGAISRNLITHFEDFDAGGGRKVTKLWRLLNCIAPIRKGKPSLKDLPPNLAPGIVRSAFTGTNYPPLLRKLCAEAYLRSRPSKDKNEHSRNRVRARCIRACLVREARLANAKEDLAVSLDTNNPNVGYRLGRLFAFYEQIQRTADPEVNATIRDTMFIAATRSPRAVFTTLRGRSNHQLAKLRKGGRAGLAFYFDQALAGIYEGISSDGLPERLSPADRDRFVVGHMHQMLHRDTSVPAAEITALDSADAETASNEG